MSKILEFPSVAKTAADLIKVEPKNVATKKKQPVFTMVDVSGTVLQKTEDGESPTLAKSIMNLLNQGPDSIERLAFTVNPTLNNTYGSIFKAKQRLIPDDILKRIAIQDDLIASIVQVRCNQMASFAVPRRDRFSVGFVIEPKTGLVEKLNPEQKADLDKRIEAAVIKLNNCGSNNGWSDINRCSLSEFIRATVRNAMVVGRSATEILWATDVATGKQVFHSFRAIDAGTIYKATPQRSAAQSIRDAAFQKLQDLVGPRKKLIPETYNKGEYTWVQVVNNTPIEVFTSQECVVHNFYPVPDVELDGYPVTPIDTMIAAVTTHINITTHNKVYFQNGRASRGMIVIESEDVDEAVLNNIKQQFNASINGVGASWRMPVFGVSVGEKLSWQSIDSVGRDMEFQYLTDMNARVILSAFQMSPDELPGWSYLSRGTNSQSLSESNNEFRMQAARDLGMRPLIAHLEDLINTRLFPLIDPTLSDICKVRFMGLDSDNAEKEAIRLQQNMSIDMTYNNIMSKVEKPTIPKEFGGDFPLNPVFGAVLSKYKTVGQVQEFFFGIKDASKDPSLAYIPDAMWMQWQSMRMQQQQMAQQAAQPQPAPGGDGGSGGPGVADNKPQAPADGKPDVQGSNGEGGEDNGPNAPGGANGPETQTEDLTRSIDQAMGILVKSEAELPESKRRLLAQQKATIHSFIKNMASDFEKANKEIKELVSKNVKKAN